MSETAKMFRDIAEASDLTARGVDAATICTANPASRSELHEAMTEIRHESGQCRIQDRNAALGVKKLEQSR